MELRAAAEATVRTAAVSEATATTSTASTATTASTSTTAAAAPAPVSTLCSPLMHRGRPVAPPSPRRDTDCPICFEQRTLRKMQVCNHEICTVCVLRVYRCPICRAAIESVLPPVAGFQNSRSQILQRRRVEEEAIRLVADRATVALNEMRRTQRGIPYARPALAHQRQPNQHNATAVETASTLRRRRMAHARRSHNADMVAGRSEQEQRVETLGGRVYTISAANVVRRNRGVGRVLARRSICSICRTPILPPSVDDDVVAPLSEWARVTLDIRWDWIRDERITPVLPNVDLDAYRLPVSQPRNDQAYNEGDPLRMQAASLLCCHAKVCVWGVSTTPRCSTEVCNRPTYRPTNYIIRCWRPARTPPFVRCATTAGGVRLLFTRRHCRARTPVVYVEIHGLYV